MNKKDDFKLFVKDNNYLINYVKEKKYTWQDFYELFDLYGNDEEVWKKYLSDNNKTSTGKIEDIINAFKNVDINKVQDGVDSLQKTLALFGELISSKNGNSSNYNPRPLYRKFQD